MLVVAAAAESDADRARAVAITVPIATAVEETWAAEMTGREVCRFVSSTYSEAMNHVVIDAHWFCRVLNAKRDNAKRY